MRHRAATGLALAAAAVALAGCGLGPGRTPHGATLTITTDFGGRSLHTGLHPRIAGRLTVMQLLARNVRLTTRYGGGFVESINGVAGGQTAAGDPVDWFYYVNGEQADKGAAATVVHDGDQIWWDRHDWSATEDVPAVVGSYPAPFSHGIGGQRIPLTLYCVSGTTTPACRTVISRLRATGEPVTFGALGTDEPQTLRVLVGTFVAMRRDPAAAFLTQGPRTSGVYVRMAPSGRSMQLLDARGDAVQTLGSGAGLVAADRIPDEVPTWLITGTDAAGVQAAARLLDAHDLHDRFAVATSDGHVLGLPRP